MGKHTDQRDRTLCLTRILYEETDEKHPLTMRQIIQRLQVEGVSAERKSIYRDLAAMNKQGFPVEYRPGKSGGWYASGRPMSLGELQAVIDAVTVYRWLPAALRQTLLDKLAALFPQTQRDQLRRPVCLSPRTAGDPEEVRRVLDRIHTAIQTKRALSFVPFDYGVDRQPVTTGTAQVVSPKGLLWWEDGYHLLGWDHRAKHLALFRPDRMTQVLVTGMPTQGPDPDPALWTATPFGVEPNRRERICLGFCPTLTGEVLDRLGPSAELTAEESYYTATADVILGPTFLAWLSTHAEEATLLAPAWAANLWATRYRPRPIRQAPRPHRQVV